MKFASLQAALGSALLLSFAPPSLASHGHQLAHHHYGRRHGHGSVHAHLEKPRDVDDKLVRRGTCALPNDPTVVSVPGAMNGGWAMAPRQVLHSQFVLSLCLYFGNGHEPVETKHNLHVSGVDGKYAPSPGGFGCRTCDLIRAYRMAGFIATRREHLRSLFRANPTVSRGQGPSRL